MSNVQWTVGGGGEQPSPSASQKILHIPMTRASDKSTDSEKESVRLWNLMRKTLLDNGFMETKEEMEARKRAESNG